MTEPSGTRPLFIDPAPAVSGGEIAERPAPGWFRAVALLVAAAAVWVLATQLSGPPLSWRHNFVHGRDAAPTSTPTPAP